MNFFGFDFATREEPAKLEQGHMEESAQDNGEAEGDGGVEGGTVIEQDEEEQAPEVDEEIMCMEEEAALAAASALELADEAAKLRDVAAKANEDAQDAESKAAELQAAAAAARSAADAAPLALEQLKQVADAKAALVTEPATLLEELVSATALATIAHEQACTSVESADKDMAAFEAKTKKKEKKKMTADEKQAVDVERSAIQHLVDKMMAEEAKNRNRLARCQKEEDDTKNLLEEAKAAALSAAKAAASAESDAQKSEAEATRIEAEADVAADLAAADREAATKAIADVKSVQELLAAAQRKTTQAKTALSDKLMTNHVARAASNANSVVESWRRGAARRVAERKAVEDLRTAKEEAMLAARSDAGMNRQFALKAAVPRSNRSNRLPDGWETFIDPTSGRRYYVDLVHNTSSWDPPPPPPPPLPRPKSASNLYPYASRLMQGS
jgi:hypothetical protein